MLVLDNIRQEFAKFLSEDPSGRWRMDAALAHVVQMAYQQGIEDGMEKGIAYQLDEFEKKPVARAMQYYYTQNGCKAKTAEDSDCICWFDQGTGPFEDTKQGDLARPTLRWRLKPAAMEKK